MEKTLKDILSYSNYQNRAVYNRQIVEASKQSEVLTLQQDAIGDGMITEEQKIRFFKNYGLESYYGKEAQQLEHNRQILKTQFFDLVDLQQKLLEGPKEHPQKYLEEAIELSAYLTLVLEEAQALHEMIQLRDPQKKASASIA